MIELNLLPQELRKKKRKKIELPEIPIIPIAIGFVGILVVIQFLLLGITFLCNTQVARLDKEWQNLAPKKSELDVIKRKISNTDEKIKAIEDLIEKSTSWSRLLNELSNSLTANIWLNELSYDERADQEATKSGKKAESKDAKKVSSSKGKQGRTGILRLSGSAAGRGEEATTYIARFITSLKDNEDFFEDFEDIELISIKKGSIAGQDVMDFIIVCKFSPEKKGK